VTTAAASCCCHSCCSCRAVLTDPLLCNIHFMLSQMQPAPAWPGHPEAVWAQHTRLYGPVILAGVCQQQGPCTHRVPEQQAGIQHSSIRRHPLGRPHSKCFLGGSDAVLVGCQSVDSWLAGWLPRQPHNSHPLLLLCPAAGQVTPARYMEAICAMQPDMFVALADEVCACSCKGRRARQAGVV
jgi:hypothetical protein